MIGGDGHGPDRTVVIVGILHESRHGSADADAVASHDHRVGLALFVEVFAFHRGGIFGSELEDVSDFDTALHLERFACDRAGVAFADGCDVGYDCVLEVASVVEVDVVETGFIGADDEVRGAFDGAVDNDDRLFRVDSDGGSVTGNGSSIENLLVVRKCQFLDFEEVLQLGFVDLEVAADENEDETFVGICVEDRLAGVFRFDVQEFGNVFNRFGVRSCDFFHRQFGCAFKFDCGDCDFAVRLVAVTVG